MSEQADSVISQPAEKEPRSLFKYSTWIHAGAGADDCTEVDEDAGTNRCADAAHFHAWIRLPNPFQYREIRERALAAKARKLRQLRSPGSDSADILDGAIDVLAADGEDGKTLLVEELIQHNWWRDYLTAVREIRDLEDEGEGAEDGAKLYAHVEEDQRRFAELSASEDTSDELEELRAHLKRYSDAVEERCAAIVDPKRAGLTERDVNDLLDMVRTQRIETEAQQEFNHHYSMHEWLSCTFREFNSPDLVFTDLAHMTRAASEVLAEMQTGFQDLERTAQEAQGN